MSEDFIPLNQSTPTGNRWQKQGRIHHRGIHVHYNNVDDDNRQNQQNQSQSGPSRRQNYNRRGNYSQRNSSFGSDSTNNSYNQDGPPIDAYIHPAMLQDPWEQLRRKLKDAQ